MGLYSKALEVGCRSGLGEGPAIPNCDHKYCIHVCMYIYVCMCVCIVFASRTYSVVIPPLSSVFIDNMLLPLLLSGSFAAGSADCVVRTRL